MKQEYPRIPPELREYLPLLSSGLHWLKSSWEFPEIPPGERRKVALRLDDEAAADITYLAKHMKKSREAVITAALIYAKNGKRRPGDAQASDKPPNT